MPCLVFDPYVSQVHDLVDQYFVRHDAVEYSNPPIAPGDRILKVDDMLCENVSAETLHRMLSGLANTPVKLSLARISDGTSFSVTVMRHSYHAFDAESRKAETDVNEVAAAQGHRHP